MNTENKIKKPVGITIFLVIAGIMAAAILLHQNPLANPQDEIIKKVMSVTVIAIACVVFVRFYDKFTVLPKELYDNRRLIWRLSKNDFKKRYAGSYLGIVWALIQPVVTVVMYWFVFQNFMGAKAEVLSGGDTAVPYFLFLAAGLCPWFFFSEALMCGTTALLEYNYLVKKVVFKISILPIIKIIACLFIHAFFILVVMIIGAIY